MYNRILHRPMFKLGGKTNNAQGTGITSGLDGPRQGYAENSFVEKLSEIDVSVPAATRKRAFWTGYSEKQLSWRRKNDWWRSLHWNPNGR